MLSDFAGNYIFGHDIYRFDFQYIAKHVDVDPTASRTVRFIDTMDILKPCLWPDFSPAEIPRRHRRGLAAGLSSIRRHDAQGDAILLAHVFQRIQVHPELDKLCSKVSVHEALLPSTPSEARTEIDQARLFERLSFPIRAKRFLIPGTDYPSFGHLP